MMRLPIFFFTLSMMILSACSESEPDTVTTQVLDNKMVIDVSWSFDSLDTQAAGSVGTFILSNNGSISLEGTDWAIYYNQLASATVMNAESGMQITRINGGFFKLFPNDEFTPITPGEKRIVRVNYGGYSGRISYSPTGMYLVDGAGEIYTIDDAITYPGNAKPEINDLLIEDLKARYDENVLGATLSDDELSLVPAPTKFKLTGNDLVFSSYLRIGYSQELANEAAQLKQFISKVYTGTIESQHNSQTTHINLSIDPSVGDKESYHLEVTDDKVIITGADQAGVYYGIQTLRRLISIENYKTPSKQLAIRGVNIEDEPRFSYRGMHIDVARNFHSLSHIVKIIDLLAYYKLNKLLLTLTNDEGWRIEIPGLPELTDIGSKRGHTIDESDMLAPAYGSGPYADSEQGNGTGFYTKKDFIALLRYANERHVEIIPEIDFPGHARAAIKAMEARYFNFLLKGDRRNGVEYLINDLNDESEYLSPQLYNDNVVCVCQESSYRFINKVVGEIAKMYEEAEAPFNAIHSGGDEIPVGSWTESPICKKFIEENDDIESTDQLQAYFLNRFMEILQSHDLTTAGWEEIVLETNDEGHNGTDINFDFVGEDVLPYAWNSTWGWGREDMAYQLANGGYKVVMCNSSVLYFDLAYNRDPAESGLTWSGFVDTRDAFEFEPFDMFATATHSMAGDPLDAEYVASKTRLKRSAQKNILGIQAQLWSESIRNSDMLDYYLFPKLLALSERAWSPAPDWTKPNTLSKRLAKRTAAWDVFAQTTSRVELPRLDYFGDAVMYRIPMVGAQYHNGMLHANVRFPGQEIRYTTDGSEPTMSSTLYEGPVTVEGNGIRVRVFNAMGRGGRSSVVETREMRD